MMSNITKNFKAKAKRGLCMAQGGLLEQQVQQTLQPQTAAPAPAYMDWQERENAEKTARWRQDDLLSRGVAPQQTATLGTALQQPQQAAKPGAAPAYTDWQERENAEKTARWRQDDLLSSAGRGRGLRMADGGMVPETAEQVMARMASKYGTTGAAQAAPVAQPAPVQAPQPVAQPKPAVGGLFGRALGGLRQANEQLRQVSNYAEGGIVRGKGGPTDDEVPMNIGGTDVNLSNEEAVLPAKTVTALGGPEAVEELIEKTNGKPPVRKGLRQGGEYGYGVVPYDATKDLSRAHVPYTPPIDAPRTTGFVQDGVRMGEKVPTRPNFENVSRAVVPVNEMEMPRGEAPRVATQDGVRIGQQGAQSASRPNWIDPTKQVATVANQPHISDPGAIEGQSRRVPNTGTAVATVEGRGARTANVDRVTQADYARGMRNGAAGAAPAAAPTPAPATQPLPHGEQFGRNAAKVYTDMGGARGMAGKAINALVPAAAALDTMGDAGIRVEGNREGDATNETAGGMTRVANAAKEIGLRAGDWGTKGADMLMDIPLWAANKAGATSDGKPLEYGLINKNYRQGMRDANLEGVTIPQSTGEQEMLNVKANAEADAFKKKHAAKDGSYGKADQGAIDALKAENAAKKADVTLAAATKAGNFAGQNHIPEAVSPADRVVADSLGGVVDSATGVSRSGDGGLRGMAKRLDTYAKNDDVRGARNMREQLMGSGARFDKGTDGKITITNRGDFDGSTKMAYTGADGNPTAVHEGSQQHMQGLKDAQGLRNQLANFEQMNLKRNAQDDITDIGLRNSSRAALAAQGAQQAELTKARIAKEPSALDLEKHELEKQKFRHDLVKTNNLQGNNVRDFKAAQSAHMAKRTQTLLDNLVPTAGLKDDDLKLAQQDRADYEQALYAAHKRMPADDAEFDSNLPNVAAQAKLTMAHKKAMQGAGLWQKLSNAGVNPMITLTSMAPKIVGDNFVYENGYTLPTKLVLGNDPALLAAHRAREQTK